MLMPTYIAMLRGVNLASRNRMKMDVLRSVCESIGLENCETHIQSGNVIFNTAKRDPERIAREMEASIEKQFGFRAPVILRTPAELKNVIEKAPFISRPDFEPARLLIYFLASALTDEARLKLKTVDPSPEQLAIGVRELFIYYPNGMARPKLSLTSLEKKIANIGTGRNWTTVNNLLEIAMGR